MANAPADPNEAHAEAVADAKRLMRLARTGALATLEAEGAGLLTTLVGVASDFDGAPLFLMSTLSRHTRNLARDPRASLLLTGARDRGDPLNHPRVTLGGRVEPDPAGRAKSRYLQRNRKAALYAGFSDFGMFRLRIESVHFNGGFGRAAPLAPADVLASRAGEAALGEAEERLIAEVNALGEPRSRGLRATRPPASRRPALARDRPRRRGPRPRRRRPRRPRPVPRPRRRPGDLAGAARGIAVGLREMAARGALLDAASLFQRVRRLFLQRRSVIILIDTVIYRSLERSMDRESPGWFPSPRQSASDALFVRHTGMKRGRPP